MEILQHVAEASDSDSAGYFFRDLADANDATGANSVTHTHTPAYYCYTPENFHHLFPSACLAGPNTHAHSGVCAHE